MRILHVIDNIQPEMGGPPVVAMQLGIHQAQAGHEVHLASYDFSNKLGNPVGVFANHPKQDLVTLHLLDQPDKKEVIFGRKAKRELKTLVKEFDALHIHNLWEGIQRAAASCAKENNIPYAVTMHGMLDEWSFAQSNMKKRIALSIGVKRMLQEATYLHVLSPAEGAMMQKLEITAPTKKIPNGINPEAFENLPEAGQFYKDFKRLNEQPYILFLSRLHHKKGLDILAAAFAQVAKHHPDLQLVIVGPDEGALTPLQEQLKDLQIEKRVHIIGPLYGDHKLAAINDALCFCLPSRQEGFSVAILEALACAKPVVITEACHFPEVAEAEAGLIAKVDADAIAKELNTLVSDITLRDKFSKHARELVMSQYTWPTVTEQITQAYKANA